MSDDYWKNFFEHNKFPPITFLTNEKLFSLEDAILLYLRINRRPDKIPQDSLLYKLIEISRFDHRINAIFFDNFLKSLLTRSKISQVADKPAIYFIEKLLDPESANILANLVKTKLYDFLEKQKINDIRLNDVFFENYHQSILKDAFFQNAIDKSADFFEYMGLDTNNANILESIMTSAESSTIISKHHQRGRSPMRYLQNTVVSPLNEITEKEIYYLVNNYSEKRKQCVDMCLLRSRPSVVLSGTNAGKLLVNVNPFRFLNSKMVSKYNLDIKILIKVGDFLLDYNKNSLLKSIELLLRKYYKKSNLKLLLYADCIIGFYVYGLMDVNIYPYTYPWETGSKNVHPTNLLKNYGWVVFDMIMNMSHLITMISYKIPAELKTKNKREVIVAKIDTLQIEMNKYLEYDPNTLEGFMSNYSNSSIKLGTTCIFSTLLEACIIQEKGVPSHEIFLRLENAYLHDYLHTNYNNVPRSRWNLLKIPNKKFEGCKDTTHWVTYYEGKNLRSVFDMCTDKEINFGENKLEIAMLIIYPFFSYLYKTFTNEVNIKQWLSRIYQSEDTKNEIIIKGKEFIFGNYENILLLERQVRTILENTIPASLIISQDQIIEKYKKKLIKSEKNIMETIEINVNKLNSSWQKSKRPDDPSQNDTRRVRSRFDWTQM